MNNDNESYDKCFQNKSTKNVHCKMLLGGKSRNQFALFKNFERSNFFDADVFFYCHPHEKSTMMDDDDDNDVSSMTMIQSIFVTLECT